MISYENLRPWQKRFVRKFNQRADQTFLLVALPGGGKTIASLFAANTWLKKPRTNGRNRYLITVVPTRNLRGQWQKAAKNHFNLEMQTEEFTGALKPGMNGCVITYSALAASPETFRHLCAKHEVFVIFDEVHHLGDGASWGNSAKLAFYDASCILAMSGTPWRSDAGQIPFLQRDPQSGEYKIHDRFDWPLALEEDPRATRYLKFKPQHGSAEFLDEASGERLDLNSRDQLSEYDEARCLRGRLKEERFVDDVLSKANDQLMEVRRDKPDAKGLVVCMDQEHAKKVVKRLKKKTRKSPALAVSDETISDRDTIDRFAKSNDEWIVSVRQISEGVDIPSLIVGVYLTNWVTELYFRQFVGRIARYQGTEADEEAYMFMPHHSKLMQYAEKIMDLQAVALANRQAKEGGAPSESNTARESSLIYLGGSGAESAGMVLPGIMNADEATAREIEAFARENGLNSTRAALLLQKYPQLNDALTPLTEPCREEEPLEKRLKRERKRQGERIAYLHQITRTPYGLLNKRANDYAGCEKVELADMDELEKRREFIERSIQRARKNEA